MPGSSAQVAIIDQNSGKKFHVQLPTSVRVAQVLPALVKQLKLPTEGPGGQDLQYDLTLETQKGKARLAENDVLVEAGVVDGVTIRITPRVGTTHLEEEARSIDWRYLDFDIHISASRDGYRAKVLTSPAGQASEVFVPPDPKDVQICILQMGHNRGTRRSLNAAQLKAARQFGGDLFQRLFHGQILAALTASLQKVADPDQDCGLRIRLLLDEAPDLMGLPWEFLYYPARRVFLVSQEHTPIVRFLSLPEMQRPLQASLPLRILGMVSSPADLVQLDVEQEKQKLESALAPLVRSRAVSIHWVQGGSLAALFEHLRDTNLQYHVFHFIGHGGFDDQTGEGFLALEGGGKRFDAVSGEHLGPILQKNRQRFKLAVLNACEGGRVGLTNPFPGLAPSLIQVCNLSAVVAMQFEITDAAAITFATNFYASIAAACPVDTAITSARLALWALAGTECGDVEWGTPVLYMRSPNGQLFDLKSAQA